MESRHLKILLRWSWLLILFPIISTAAGFVVLQQQPTVYEAEATLMIGPGIDSPNPDLNALRAGEQLMQTYVELPGTHAFLEAIITNLGLSLNKGQLDDIILMRPLVGTQLVGVIARDENQERAVLIANEVANHLVTQGPSSEQNDFLFDRIRQQAAHIEEDILSIDERIDVLTAQLAVEDDIINQNLLIQQINEEERRLSESNSTLADLYQTLQEPLTNRIAVIDTAEEAVELGNQTLLTLLIAFGAGLVVSVLVGIGLIALNNDVLDISTVNSLNGLPIWATVRPNRQPALVTAKADTARQYNQLGAQILSAEQQSLLFTSLSKTDHVPEIVANIAAAIARTQNPIMLIDVNFHDNNIARLFGIDNGMALAKLLSDSGLQDEALNFTEVAPYLNVLPSGSGLTESSFSWLASPRMNQIVAAIKQGQGSDVLLLAAPPIADGEDSLPLVHQVDGVVLVLKNRTVTVTRIRDGVTQIENLGGRVEGIILVR